MQQKTDEEKEERAQTPPNSLAMKDGWKEWCQTDIRNCGQDFVWLDLLFSGETLETPEALYMADRSKTWERGEKEHV